MSIRAEIFFEGEMAECLYLEHVPRVGDILETGLVSFYCCDETPDYVRVTEIVWRLQRYANDVQVEVRTCA